MAKILVVDDDPFIVQLIVTSLASEHALETACDGAMASELLRFYKFDLAIIDWELPGKDGLQICSEYRLTGGKMPILLLTCKTDIEEKEAGLDAGADDYMTKPFELRELKARLIALLRRSPFETTIRKFGELVLDMESCTLRNADREIRLLRKEAEVLEMLMNNGGEYLSTERILAQVWGDASVSAGALVSCIKRLRKKIDNEGERSFIETAPRLGYRLVSRGRTTRGPLGSA